MKLAKKPCLPAGRRIYMDYASGLINPGGLHREGVSAKKKLEDARARVASVLGARPFEIIFTGGGTEANNLAIMGIVALKNRLPAPHIITTNIEHASVLETCRHLEKTGQAKVTYVPVEPDGIVDPRKIEKAFRPNTILVSVMYANNEIGTIQPIREIAKIIRHFRKRITPPNPPLSKGRVKGGVLFHTDAVQAANYLNIRPDYLGVDLMTLNSSKIYEPKGVGMLYIRAGTPILPITFGGDQEFGLRPGTENVSAISDFAKALKTAQGMREKESARLVKLRDYFINKISPQVRPVGIILNGDAVRRLPNIINISVPGVESEMLVLELDARGIAVSSKSACKSGSGNASHVLKAIRPKTKKEEGTLRVSLGRATTKSDIDYLLKSLRAVLSKLTRQKLWH